MGQRLFGAWVRRVAVGVVVAVVAFGSALVVSVPSPAAALRSYASAVEATSPYDYWQMGDGASWGTDEMPANHPIGGFDANSTTGMDVGGGGTALRWPGGAYWNATGANDMNSRVVSVEMWFKPESVAVADGLYQERSSCGGGTSIDIGLDSSMHPTASVGMDELTNDGGFAGDVETITSPRAAALGRWHQVVLTAGDGELQLWFDDQLVQVQAANHPGVAVCSYQRTLDVTVGAGRYSYMSLDDIAFYKKILTPFDVHAHWQVSGRAPALGDDAKLGGSNGSAICIKCMLNKLRAGDPVDPSTGNFYESATDVDAGGRGVGLSFTRTYNSARAGTVGWLGHGWTSNWETSLDLTSEAGAALVRQENGAVAEFDDDGSGNWVAGPYIIGTLTHSGTSPSDTWTFSRNHDSTLVFDHDGHLTSITDLNGYTTTLTYPSGSALPSTITESTDTSGTAGRSLSLSFSGNFLTSVTDPMGEVTSYSVNGTTHDLDSVTDPRGGVTNFTYDSTSHELKTMQSPQESALHGNDGTTGAVTNHYDSAGRVDEQWTATATSGVSGVNTNPTTFDYSVTDETTITDPEGNVTVQDYDNGFLAAETAASGTADAGTWTYTYDPTTGGMTTVTDPNGNVTTNTYYGDCTGLTDCASGRLHTTTNGVDPATTYTYDSTSGLVKTVTAPYGTGSDTATTTYSYSSHVFLTSVATPLYDNGSPRSLVGTQTTSYTHGDSSHPEDVTAVTDPRGKVSTFTYDAYGQPVTATDPLGHETTTSYDGDGRVVSSVVPKGNASGGNPDEYRSAVLRDPGGLVLASLGAGGYPVVDNFDRANGSLGSAQTGQSWTNVTGTFAVDGHEAELSSASGSANLATVPAGSDVTLSFTVGAVQDGVGVTWRAASTTSDERLVMSTTSSTWKLVYDGNNQRTTTGSGTCCSVGQHVVVRTNGPMVSVWIDGVLKFARSDNADATNTGAGLWAGSTGAGRIDDFAVSRNVGSPTFASYDADGFAVQATDGNENTTNTSHDADDRPLVVTRPDATTLSYAYDGNGQQTSYTDGGGNTTSYAYDHQGRLASSTRPGMSATSYAYAYSPGGSPGGETATVTQPSGATVTSTMDAAGRVASVDYSSSGTPDVSMSYDHAGNEISMTTGGGTASTWSYDDLGRMTASSRAGRDVAYGYDLAGNQTSITYPGSHTVTMGYDDAGREHTLTDWVSGADTTFGYDANDNLTSTAYPNGITDTDTYDDADNPTVLSVDNTSTSTNLATFTNTFDAKSQITKATYAGTSVTAGNTLYRYNSLSKVTGTNAVFDTADNLTKTFGVGGTPTFQGFNSSGQLCWTATTSGTGCTTPTGGTSYSYNADGDRTTKTPSTGTATSYGYDQADRLTSISGPLTASYSYDGDGLRLSKTVSSTTTNYTWDDSSPLPMLLVDGTDDYLYGPDGNPIERITSAGTPTFINHDFMGTRILTNSSGTVTGTYGNYGTFGQIGTTTGTARVNLLYRGQYQDTETANYYLRARYYEPTTGQFLTQDPAVASTQESYGYAGGDPANNSDPTGLATPHEAFVMVYLILNGYTVNQAAGVVGNLAQESGEDLDPTAVQRFQDGSIGPGRGIVQWGTDVGRWQKEEQYCGASYLNFDSQVRYMLHELQSDFPNTDAMLRASAHSSEAEEIIQRYYEIAGKPIQENRIHIAHQLAKEFRYLDPFVRLLKRAHVAH